jgi:hypothetical protein
MKRLVLLASLAACATTAAPAISESRMTIHPANAPDCLLMFLRSDMTKMMPGGEWEVVGFVTIGAEGEIDPTDEKYRELVRPRACAMGGEAVTVFIASRNQSDLGVGAGVIYGVLRRPTPAPAGGPF